MNICLSLTRGDGAKPRRPRATLYSIECIGTGGPDSLQVPRDEATSSCHHRRHSRHLALGSSQLAEVAKNGKLNAWMLTRIN
jgi:hypothetical protein